MIGHEAMQMSNTKYSAWRDELIHQEKEDIALQNKTAHYYTVLDKSSKSPDKFGPPLTYIETCGAFKSLATTANPLGLCWFYHVDPTTAMSALLSTIQLPSIDLGTCWERHRIKCSLTL